MDYEHHIQLRVADPLDKEDAIQWFDVVNEYAPEDVVDTYNHKGKDIAMDYGVSDGEDFSHVYLIPLKRDISKDEALFIVAAWEYLYDEDFNIELSGQYDEEGDPDDDIDWQVEEDVRNQVVSSLNKWEHNRWVDQMVSEGWRWGNYYSSSRKTHPALRNWDALPESHRRTRDISNREIFEWLRSKKII